MINIFRYKAFCLFCATISLYCCAPQKEANIVLQNSKIETISKDPNYLCEKSISLIREKHNYYLFREKEYEIKEEALSFDNIQNFVVPGHPEYGKLHKELNSKEFYKKLIEPNKRIRALSAYDTFTYAMKLKNENETDLSYWQFLVLSAINGPAIYIGENKDGNLEFIKNGEYLPYDVAFCFMPKSCKIPVDLNDSVFAKSCPVMQEIVKDKF